MDDRFWSAVEVLVESSEIKIDRPKGSSHPRHPDVVYPLDYGYLMGTQAGDQSGIDLWIGRDEGRHVTGVLCTIDLDKGDAEVKILLGCTKDDAREILAFHNQGSQSGMLIMRCFG
jgi:inorganic pyrophosphatase